MADVKTLATNLKACWEFKDGALTTDSHGSNTLTNNGSCTFSSLVQDGGISVTAASNQYMSILSNSDIEPTSGTTPYSISTWIRPAALSGIVGWVSKEAASQGYLIFTNGTSLFFIHQGTNSVSDGTVATSTTYHIVVTYDGTNTSTSGKIYVNAGTASTANLYTYNNTSATLKIGERSDGTGNASGIIGQTCFWNGTALDSTQVSTLYNSGSGIPYEEASTFIPKIIMS